MDPATLYSANVLLLSIFAITFLAMAFQVRGRGHWIAWSAANTLFAGALVGFALEPSLPTIPGRMVPNVLLLLGLACHWHAARGLARLPSGPMHVAGPAAVYVVIGLPACLLGGFAVAQSISNAIFALLAVATLAAYSSAPFRRMIAPIGLVLAFFFQAVEAVLRTVQGIGDIGTGATAGPIPIDPMVRDIHLMFELVFVTLTGAFALALAFEIAARRHHEAARRDPLTGAFNRREFQTRLEDILKEHQPEDFGLIHFDLDHFKQVNDRFGHIAGDEALVTISNEVASHLRQNDCFARLGGEEFAVLLPSISRENAYKVAHRLRKRISALRFEFAPEDFCLTASAGIYHGDGGRMALGDLLRSVDNSLYRSKSEGRDRISHADIPLDERA